MKSLFALVPVLALVVGSAACGGDDDDDGTTSSSSSSSGGSTSSSGGSVDGGGSSSSGGDAAATSSSSSSGAAASSSSSGGGSGSEACKGFAASSAEISPTVSDDDAPAATGGQIADGTYQLTAVTDYGGNAAVEQAKVKITLVVAGGTFKRGFDLNFLIQSAVGADSGTFSATGTTLVGTADCNDGQASSQGFGVGGEYSVAGNVLSIQQDGPAAAGGGVIKLDFTKAN